MTDESTPIRERYTSREGLELLEKLDLLGAGWDTYDFEAFRGMWSYALEFEKGDPVRATELLYSSILSGLKVGRSPDIELLGTAKEKLDKANPLAGYRNIIFGGRMAEIGFTARLRRGETLRDILAES